MGTMQIMELGRFDLGEMTIFFGKGAKVPYVGKYNVHWVLLIENTIHKHNVKDNYDRFCSIAKFYVIMFLTRILNFLIYHYII